MNQLGGLVADRAKYEEKDVEIIAIAVQSQDGATKSIEKTQAQFPILADSEHTVADTYGVYSLLPDEEFQATPSVFIINRDGQITWHQIAQRFDQRVPSQTILENLP